MSLGQQRNKALIQGLHERFMQGSRADLLIVDEALNTEAAKLSGDYDEQS